MTEASTHHNEAYERTAFGFWIYLMTDLVMFAVFFAAYAVLRDNTFGGPTARELLHLPGALAETLVLLSSSCTCGFAIVAGKSGNRRMTNIWLGITFALGAAFLALELREFAQLIAEGASPERSAFLSAFFALVGAHGLHIASGLLWILVSFAQIRSRGLSPFVVSKLGRLAAFWHFLDLVWIFIFTIVYLMSHLS